MFIFQAKSEQETDRLGRTLAEVLPLGSVVALNGTLGAGKTRLVQAVAQAFSIPVSEVTSPTFVLINEYRQGTTPIFHFDTYRLESEIDFWELGPEEYFSDRGLCFIEWAERVENALPEDYLQIEIKIMPEERRDFYLSGSTPEVEKLVAQIEAILK